MADLVNTCDEIIESPAEEAKTIPKNFNEKKADYKTQSLYILVAFVFITIALLTADSNYCYLHLSTHGLICGQRKIW